MKNEDDNESPLVVSRYVYNRLVQLLSNKEFNTFTNKYREILSKGNNKHNIKLIIECKSTISAFLIKRRLPLNWIEPIFNLIKNDEFDFPYEEGLSLMIGPDELTHRTDDILVMKSIKTGVSTHSNISIKITSKVTVDTIIRFIKRYKKEIEHWQKQIELPEVSVSRFKSLNEAWAIVELKDIQGLSFYEIAEKFSNDENMKHLTDDSSIKSIYYRYKNLIRTFKD